MKKKILGLLFALLMAIPVFGQQPQASMGQTLYSANSKYTNGIAPGYWPQTQDTPPDSLGVNIGPGTSNCGGGDVFYAGGQLTMTNNTTNYIDLSATNCVPEVSIVGYQSNMHIALVVTSEFAVTSLTDTRTLFFRGGGPTGGGQNYFNVKLYGSICDGVTRVPDDGPGIMAAASAAAISGPYSTVLIPAGSNCIVNSYPTFNEAGLNIEGYGSQITSTNADWILQFSGENQAFRGVMFRDDTPGATNHNAIQLVAVNGFLLEDSGIISNAAITPYGNSGIGLLYTNRTPYTYDQLIPMYLADPSMNTNGSGGASPFSRNVRVFNCKCIEKQGIPMVTGLVSVINAGGTATVTLISGQPFNTAWALGAIQIGSVSYPLSNTTIQSSTQMKITSGPATIAEATYNYSLQGADQCIQYAFTKSGQASGNYIFGYATGIQFWGGDITTLTNVATTTTSGGVLTDDSDPFDTTPGSPIVGSTLQMYQTTPALPFPTLYFITSVVSASEITITPVIPCPPTISCPQNLTDVGYSTGFDNLTAPRMVQDLTVENNVCEGCSFWGAYGKSILFTGNFAYGGPDVGIDFEGTLDSQMVGNTCHNFPNGCLTVFHSCRSILISGNHVTQDNSVFPMAPIYGDLYNCTDTKVDNNDFTSLDPTAPGTLTRSFGFAAFRDFNNNKFNNVLAQVFFETPIANLIGNQFEFTYPFSNSFNALLAYREDEFWPPAVPPSLLNIRGNTITSTVAQPAGTIGVACAFGDGVHSGTGTCIIDGNVFQGPVPLPVDIALGDGEEINEPSPPNGPFVTPTFVVTNNKLHGPVITGNFSGGYLGQPVIDIAGNLDLNTGRWYNTLTNIGSGGFNPSTTILGPDVAQVNPDLTKENPNSNVANYNFSGCSGAACSKWTTSSSDWSFSSGGASWDGTAPSLLSQSASNAAIPLVAGAYYDVSVDFVSITGSPILFVHGEVNSWNVGNGQAMPMALGVQHLIIQANGRQQPFLSLYAQTNAGYSSTLEIAYVDCHLLGGSGVFQGNLAILTIPVYASISDAENDGMTPGQLFQNSSGEVFVVPPYLVSGPDAPTDLVATAGSLSVSLTWDASANCPYCTYNVYYGTVSSPTTLFGNVGTATSATITGLISGTEYYFMVVPINDAGSGTASSIANATPTS